jgi:hypothetical protein
VGRGGIGLLHGIVRTGRADATLIVLHPEAEAEVGTGFEPVYTALQAVASPLGQPTG